MNHVDVTVCGQFVKRIHNNNPYIVVSNTDHYANITSIDTETVIYDKVRDIYFNDLTINSTVTVNGQLDVV